MSGTPSTYYDIWDELLTGDWSYTYSRPVEPELRVLSSAGLPHHRTPGDRAHKRMKRRRASGRH